MELLLNLTWLLLALPAYWMWQGRRGTRRFSSRQCLMALGFVLVVLFPVVSATDDLHAMRRDGRVPDRQTESAAGGQRQGVSLEVAGSGRVGQFRRLVRAFLRGLAAAVDFFSVRAGTT